MSFFGNFLFSICMLYGVLWSSAVSAEFATVEPWPVIVAKNVASRGCGAGLIRTPELAKEIVRRHSAVVSIHDLRTRRAGHRSFIQLHLELPPEMSLIEAHRISDEVEDAIKAAFPDAEVLTHQDPAGVETIPSLAKK